MLIDSHCHIPHKNYTKTPAQLIEDAHNNGVTKLVTIGTSIKDNDKVIETAEKYSNVYAAIGIYPHDDLKIPVANLELELNKQLNQSLKVKAVGECGIDITNWQGGRPITEQLELFEMQVDLALKHHLPVVIHNRNGDDYILNVLHKHKNSDLKAVMHCFVGTWEFAQQILDLGHYLSFSGIITYNSGISIHETVKKTPTNRILLETDSPYLSPAPHRNQTNEPKNVKLVAEKVAALKNIEFAQLCEITYNNTCKFFNIED